MMKRERDVTEEGWHRMVVSVILGWPIHWCEGCGAVVVKDEVSKSPRDQYQGLIVKLGSSERKT
jgi:hypothetical protein